MSEIQGSKGGQEGGKPPVIAPDSLFSIARARIMDLLSEGECEGWASGPGNELKDFFLDETPIENADGTKNFKDLQVAWRYGTQSQEYIQGFPSVESEVPAAVELKNDVPYTHAFTNLALSACRIRISTPGGLSKTDPANGNVGGYKIEYAIDLATNGGAFVEVLLGALDGKSSAKYERSHRIDFPPQIAGSSGWIVRVRRITVNTTDQYIQDQTNIESYTEIVDAKLRYPNSALVALSIDASQFPRIPRRAFRWKGLKISIPSNYNPTTRVYTGIWDGTFVNAWTNNPAWIYYDMLLADRYGLGDTVQASQVDKWALYAIARYCDEYVPSGQVLRAANVTTGSATLSVTSTGFARASGSFLTNGFLVGDHFTASGFSNSGNNGDWEIAAVTALTITVRLRRSLTVEAAAAARTLALRSPKEPRFQCTVYLQRRADAYKVMQDLASVFRGLAYWAGGAVVATQDAPSDPVFTYTNSNVVNGRFTYQGTGRRARHSVVMVSWNDPDDFGRGKVEYLEDAEAILRYGVQELNITAFGCLSQGQAQRVGKWTLETEKYETDTVSFEVGYDGTLVAPGRVVRIADESRAGKRIAGRITSATISSIVVDKMPDPAPVPGDTMYVAMATGLVETRVINTVVGGTRTITPTTNFSAIPVAEGVWAVESTTLAPATYRILSVAEGEGSTYQVSAIRHEPGKYAAVDDGTLINPRPTSLLPSTVVQPPSAMTLTSAPRAGQVLASLRVDMDWDDAPKAVAYRLQWQRDNEEWSPVNEVIGTHHQIENAFPGVYQARIWSVGSNGITSRVVLSQQLTVLDQVLNPTNLQSAIDDVAAAEASAAAANAALANIASDSLLTPNEKPTVIMNRDDIVNEQADIDAKATLYGITTEKTNYDAAVTALLVYLNTLTTAVLWNNLGGNTTIVGATFRTKFLDVYETRQLLLNRILQAAKTLADAAQAAANAAQADATQSLADLTNIASDSLLTPGEKPAVVLNRDELINEQAGIDAQATQYGVTTEKTAYDNAITALVAYLATLTTPVLWSNIAGNTTIVGVTFRSKFLDVYNTRQDLLQEIANVVTYGNTSGNGTNFLWDEYAHFPASPLPPVSVLNGAITPVWVNVTPIGTGGCMTFTTQSVSTGEGAYLGVSGTDYNIPLAPGKYIFSAYVAGTGAHEVAIGVRTNHAGGFVAGPNHTIIAGWQRISFSLDLTSHTAMTALLPYLYSNRSGVAGRIARFAMLMIEPQIGGSTVPSPWVVGSGSRAARTALADAAAAQTAADDAQVDATAANAELANIALDSLLTPNEKPTVIQNRDEIINEQADIDAKATSYGITTEKTNYDAAITALTAYLATLTTPVLWSNLAGNTTIVGATFRTKFLDVYADRQVLLNRIAAEAGERANWEEILRGPVDPLNLVRQPKWQDVLDAEVMWGTNYGVGTGVKADVFTTTAAPNGATNVLRWNSVLSGIWLYEQGPGISVEPLQRFKVRALLYLSAAGTVAAQLRFQKIDGTYVFGTTSANTAVTGAWTWCEAFVEAPANAKLMWPAFTVTGTATGYCAEVSITRAMNLDNDIEDGTDYGRFSSLDGYTSGGVRRQGLRFGLSGHRIGDQRNMVMVRTGSTGSRWSGAAITYTVPSTGSPAVVNIAVASGSLQAGSVAVSYNAANANVNQTRNTTVTYYLYYIDGSYAGGTKTLNITTDAANLSNADDRVWIGSATINVPVLGTGGSGGGGNEGGCVDIDMFIDRTRTAGKLTKGDFIDCVDERSRKLASVTMKVQSNKPVIEPCYRITTEGGATVTAGETTPMTLRDGRITTIGEMLGEEVIVDQEGVLRWEKVTECLPVGNRVVSYISVGGASYFAGANPAMRIATHNPLKP